MATSIVGIVLLVLTITWWAIQNYSSRKKLYEQAKKDYEDAIDAHDFNAQLDASRRMQLYK